MRTLLNEDFGFGILLYTYSSISHIYFLLYTLGRLEQVPFPTKFCIGNSTVSSAIWKKTCTSEFFKDDQNRNLKSLINTRVCFQIARETILLLVIIYILLCYSTSFKLYSSSFKIVITILGFLTSKHLFIISIE